MQPNMYTTQQIPLLEDEIITNINKAINTKYCSNNYFSHIADALTAQQLTPIELLDIMNITKNNCQIEITDTICNKLSEQNVFFEKAVDYFVTCASKNLDLVTANNITTIENPEKQQPIVELNKLTLPIKRFAMNRALQHINYTYAIILAGQHKNHIAAFDICELTDQAVTNSFNKKYDPLDDVQLFIGTDIKIVRNYPSHQWNNIFLLWDLKTGKVIHTFNESNPIHILAFNPNGSCIAAALYNENTIKIWCPKTGQLLHTLPSYYTISSLTYSSTGSILTAVNGYVNQARRQAEPPSPFITQWQLTTTDNKPGETINCSYVVGRPSDRPFIGIKYDAYRRTSFTWQDQQLSVIKKNCSPLYLCMQAIQKTNNLSQEEIKKYIERTASYRQLTDLEQKNIHNEIGKKPIALQQNNTQLPQDKNKLLTHK